MCIIYGVIGIRQSSKYPAMYVCGCLTPLALYLIHSWRPLKAKTTVSGFLETLALHLTHSWRPENLGAGRRGDRMDNRNSRFKRKACTPHCHCEPPPSEAISGSPCLIRDFIIQPGRKLRLFCSCEICVKPTFGFSQLSLWPSALKAFEFN